jgi:hypothetical protein
MNIGDGGHPQTGNVGLGEGKGGGVGAHLVAGRPAIVLNKPLASTVGARAGSQGPATVDQMVAGREEERGKAAPVRD